MVHALETIWHLVKPGGVLVDIHPCGKPPKVNVKSSETYLVGYLQETNDFVEYSQAQAAIEQAVRRGWFKLELPEELSLALRKFRGAHLSLGDKGITFLYSILADSLDEMVTFLAENWSDAILSTEVLTAASSQLEQTPGKVEILEEVQILRLRAL